MTEAISRNQDNMNIDNVTEDKMDCFVCNGTGVLSRKEVLKKLGGKDVIELLKMTEEQFFRKLEKNSPSLIKELKETLEERYNQEKELLEKKHNAEKENIKEQHSKNVKEQERIKEKEHDLELREAKRREQEMMENIAKLKSKLEQEEKAKEALETKQKSVPSLKGQAGEKEFDDWIGQYAQFECSEKLKKTGDYLVKVKRIFPNGNLELMERGNVLVDCKKDKKIAREDISKLFRDARTRGINFAYLLVENKEQFRGKDYKNRILEKDGIHLFKGDRNNFLDDMSFLEHFIDATSSEDSTDHKEQKEKLYKLILVKIEELDEFKGISANIIRETRKIDATVDEKKREIKEEVQKIIKSAEDENST